VTLGPAQVHAKEHLGPVGGFGPAGPGADSQERIALVVFTAEEKAASGDAVLALERGGFAGDIVEEALVVFVLGQLE
jgi:hypothetical protein